MDSIKIFKDYNDDGALDYFNRLYGYRLSIDLSDEEKKIAVARMDAFIEGMKYKESIK